MRRAVDRNGEAMRRVKLLGDPSVVAQEMERYERRQERIEHGTGCDLCQNCVTAWGVSVCMIGETHPRCAYRGRFRRRDDE